jgi:hypothetical protein
MRLESTIKKVGPSPGCRDTEINNNKHLSFNVFKLGLQ